MYAIVKSGGRQLRVEPRATVKVDRLALTVGDGVEFSEVLAVHNGAELTVGTPCVGGAKVVGRVVKHGRDRKIRVRTFRRKKRTRRHLGHRQDHTLVQILEIDAEQIAAVEADEEAEDVIEVLPDEDTEDEQVPIEEQADEDAESEE